MSANLLQAYAATVAMASSLVYLGSYVGLKKIKGENYVKEDQESDDEDEDESESISAEDAYMFPVIGSCALFGIYLFMKFVNKEYVAYVISAYFAIFGSGSLAKLLNLVAKYTIADPFTPFKLSLTKSANVLLKMKFTYLNIGLFIFSVALTALYTYTKNWILNNLLGVSFVMSAIPLIQLDSFKTGMILLAGLFCYDVFWVFGTDVMVSVATKFDGPIKLLWPKSFAPGILSKDLSFTLLGLGDIVLPGIFVALCLAYDRHNAILAAKANVDSQAKLEQIKQLERSPLKASYPKPYFMACFTAYVLGLLTTIFVMHTFKAAQPALLYLSPACILAPTLVALSQGKLNQLFKFETTSEADKKKKDEEVVETSKSDSTVKNVKTNGIRQRSTKI